MRSFIICMLLLAIATTTYAEYSNMDMYADMGLAYAQTQFGLKPACLTDLKTAYTVGVKIYTALTTGKSEDLFSIVISDVIPLISKLKEDCL